MNLVIALSAGILFGCGAFLILKPDLLRVVVGMVLISNAAVVALLGSGLRRGRAPILTGQEPSVLSDPLVQALALTAIVIGFAVTALLLALVYRTYRSLETVDLDELSRIQTRSEEEREREEFRV